MRINPQITSRSTNPFIIDFGPKVQQTIGNNKIKRQTDLVVGQEDQIQRTGLNIFTIYFHLYFYCEIK